MIRGLYKSASAMIPQIKKQEIIANNVANSTTAGFKRDDVFLKELGSAQLKTVPRKSDWQTPMIDQVYVDQTQGSLEQSGAPTDLGIEGDGFFVVQDASGQEFLTRNGNFVKDALGYLTTQDGDTVLGSGGPIQLREGELGIGDDGTISINGENVVRVRVEVVPDTSALKKAGDSKFHIPRGISPEAALRFAVRQGYLESSNINVVSQMVDMIASYRTYEADSQALKTQDATLQKLIGEVARPTQQ